MKSIRIGLFGCALSSVNYGCTALAFSQLKLLEEIGEAENIRMEYWVFADEREETVERIKELLGLHSLKAKYIVRIKTGLSGLNRLSRDISACDFIIDLTYGDSFSDIYGGKNFYLYSVPKLMAIFRKKPLILGPQTVGPFYNGLAERTARFILKKADWIVVRDEKSQDCAFELSGRKDILLSSDLAMNLPLIPEDGSCRKEGSVNIGLNVSLLLWNKNNTNSRLAVGLSYRDFMKQLLRQLARQGYTTHLITHVFAKSGFSEYTLAEELHKEFPDSTILAPKFEDPIAAKRYISQMDFFIGARMHATIAAFSSGVPVIPVAYSRKFEGLYGAVGYPHYIDCEKETVEQGVEKILCAVENREQLRSDLHKALAEARRRNEDYRNVLAEICTGFLRTEG